MKQHHAVVGKQLSAFGEELEIVRRADMLEHADGDDPVEGAPDRAIIDQLEADAV
ncbi:hypothetical protein D3C83_324100 [compost metagenome]